MVEARANGQDGYMNMDESTESRPADDSSSAVEQSLNKLRRSTGNTMLGGVATGIARHLNIDPVIVRIAFVVLTFIGLSGPILYLACWAFVPVEGKDKGIVGEAFGLGDNEPQVRNIGLFSAIVVAAAAALGNSAWGGGGVFWAFFWVAFWLGVPVLGIYWFLVVRPQQRAQKQEDAEFLSANQPSPTSTEPTSSVSVAEPQTRTSDYLPVTASTSLEVPSVQDSADFDDAEPQTKLSRGHGESDSGTPSHAEQQWGASDIPPEGTLSTALEEKPGSGWSPALFLITISSIAIAWGGIWLWALENTRVDASTYFASALGIIAIGLLVGTKIGNAGLLVPVGLIAAAGLAISSVAPSGTSGQLHVTPESANEVPSVIDFGAGQLWVDFSGIDDVAELEGQRIQIDSGAGEVRVVVPDDLDVEVDASVRMGDLSIFGERESGIRVGRAVAGDSDDAFIIDINHNFGTVEVTRS